MLRANRCSLYFIEAQDLGFVHIFMAAIFISMSPIVKLQWEVFPQPFAKKATIFPKLLKHNLLIII